MQVKPFLVVAVALCVAVGATIDLAARCRCDQSRCGTRRAARMERRAVRRGRGSYAPTPAPRANPYGVDGVEVLGPPAPISQRTSSPVVEEIKAPPEETPEAQATVAPADPPVIEKAAESPQDKQAAAEPPIPVGGEITAAAVWRPDPPIVHQGPQAAVPVLD